MPNITVIIAPKANSLSSDAVDRLVVPEIYVPNDKYNEEQPQRRRSHGHRESSVEKGYKIAGDDF